MNRVFTWSLVLTMLLCLPLFAAAEEVPTFDFEWEANDDSDVTIANFTGSGGDVVILEQLDRKPVTRIGQILFFSCDSLVSVILSDSVNTIGHNAFWGCFSLTEINASEMVCRLMTASSLYFP